MSGLGFVSWLYPANGKLPSYIIEKSYPLTIYLIKLPYTTYCSQTFTTHPPSSIQRYLCPMPRFHIILLGLLYLQTPIFALLHNDLSHILQCF